MHILIVIAFCTRKNGIAIWSIETEYNCKAINFIFHAFCTHLVCRWAYDAGEMCTFVWVLRPSQLKSLSACEKRYFMTYLPCTKLSLTKKMLLIPCNHLWQRQFSGFSNVFTFYCEHPLMQHYAFNSCTGNFSMNKI